MQIVMQCFDLMNRFTNRYPLSGVMILSIAVKLLLVVFDQDINPDGVVYIAAAQQIADGDFAGALNIYPMPAYPLLLTAFQFMIPDWIIAARVIGIAAMVLASIPLYGITMFLFNRQAAFWAALFFSFTPEANGQALMVIRDPFFLLTALTAIFFFLKGIHQQDLKFISLALFFTILSFLFRVEGVVIVAVPFLFLSIKSIFSKDFVLKKFARKGLTLWIGLLLTFMIVIALMFGPHLLNQNRVGQLLKITNKVVQLEIFDNYQEIYNFLKSVQSEPPFSGFSKSLPAIVRHWMPLIYLIGLMEYFIKQIFPFFLLPLLFSLQAFFHRPNRTISFEKQFVLMIWLSYMLLVLFFFITRDFIQGRYLFTPAVILYPWVGHGITLIIKWLNRNRFSIIIQAFVILIFITAPCIKSVNSAIESDTITLDVGQFISQDTNLVESKMLFSDPRHWLYGQKTESFVGVKRKAQKITKMIEMGKEDDIEKQALKKEADAIVLSINLNKSNIIPNFDSYQVYKKFTSRKEVTIIYRRKDRGKK